MSFSKKNALAVVTWLAFGLSGAVFAQDATESAGTAQEAEGTVGADDGDEDAVANEAMVTEGEPDAAKEAVDAAQREDASDSEPDAAESTQGDAAASEKPVANDAPLTSGVERINESIIGDNETSEYDLRIRELESRVNDLKERIFRSKAKLTLLTAALTGGSLGEGASVTIVHRNEMGGSYKLIEVNYFLDGAPLWQVNDDSGDTLSNGENKVVWDGNIVEGSHTLSVELVYRGTGYRLFNYHENYTFTLRDSYTFSMEAGQQFRVDAIGFERGNMTLEPEERPAIRFDTKLTEEAVLESARNDAK